MSSKLTPLQLAVLEAIRRRNAPQRNALADLFTPSPTQSNALGMFGGTYPSGLRAGFPSPGARELLRGIGQAVKAPKRRVFFSFHYQNDINRVNVVRQSWRFRPGDETQPADWFDSSLWESTKRSGTAALKRLINNGMDNTSVTCVLAGADTWRRPWVRYEIAYALARGNGLFGIYIEGVQCMQKGFCTRGNNPFDHLGLSWGQDDKAYIWEKFGGKWRKYAFLADSVKWPKWLPNVADRNYVMPLSAAVKMYDYAVQDGYANLTNWANVAAVQAGR
jgi:hypothetical protein